MSASPKPSLIGRSVRRKGMLYLKGKTLKPYAQGALDGLCAVYGIVNAARIVADLTEEEAKALFREILGWLDENENLARVLTEGITLNTVGSILREVAGDRIPERNMPFKHRPETTLEEFWNEATAFLAGGEKRALLIGVGGRHWDHWSVSHAISEKEIYFFDSHRLRHLKRSRCTTNRPTAARPHLLCPTHTYFLA